MASFFNEDGTDVTMTESTSTSNPQTTKSNQKTTPTPPKSTTSSTSTPTPTQSKAEQEAELFTSFSEFETKTNEGETTTSEAKVVKKQAGSFGNPPLEQRPFKKQTPASTTPLIVTSTFEQRVQNVHDSIKGAKGTGTPSPRTVDPDAFAVGRKGPKLKKPQKKTLEQRPAAVKVEAPTFTVDELIE